VNKDLISSEISDFLPYCNEPYHLVLSELADDLAASPEVFLDRWAAINIWESFSAKRVVASSAKSKWVEVLDDVVSILIFFPIAWTWFTLWQASVAYEEFLSRTPNSRDTFFQLWQTGFAGTLQGEFTFTGYVRTSVLVIAFLILLFIAKSRVSSNLDAIQRRLEKDWDVILAKLDIFLAAERGGNPQRFESVLDRSATELRNLMRSGNDLVSSIRDEVGTIQQNIDTVNSASISLQQIMKGISSAQQEQNQIFVDMHTSISNISTEVARIPVNLSQSISLSFETVNTSLATTVKDFAIALSSTVSNVESAMDSLRIVQEGFMRQGGMISDRLAAMMEQIPGLRGEIEASALALQAALGEVTTSWQPSKIVIDAISSEGQKSNGSE
jgi:methyl-accepting chemotaxis protein